MSRQLFEFRGFLLECKERLLQNLTKSLSFGVSQDRISLHCDLLDRVRARSESVAQDDDLVRLAFGAAALCAGFLAAVVGLSARIGLQVSSQSHSSRWRVLATSCQAAASSPAPSSWLAARVQRRLEFQVLKKAKLQIFIIQLMDAAYIRSGVWQSTITKFKPSDGFNRFLFSYTTLIHTCLTIT